MMLLDDLLVHNGEIDPLEDVRVMMISILPEWKIEISKVR